MIRLMIALLVSLAFQTSFAGDQHLLVVPESSNPPERLFGVSIDLESSADVVGSTPGVAFRICWSESHSVYFEHGEAAAASPSEGHRWIGTEHSLQQCRARANAMGLPLAWLDDAVNWPEDELVSLATIYLRAAEDFEGEIDLWVERVGAGPTVELTSEEAVVRFLPDELFRDRFQ